MVDPSRIIEDPQILSLGLLAAILHQVINKRIETRAYYFAKYREIIFLILVISLIIPVYLHNSNYFVVSGDSQGYLRSPSENTTYRPPLLWGVYRLFANQNQIDEFFNSNPKFGEKQNYPEILQGSNFIIFAYLLSLIFLIWVLYKFLKVDSRLLIIAVLIQVSGPIYFRSDHFFIPIGLVPCYKFLLYYLISKLFITEIFKLVNQRRNFKIQFFSSLVVLFLGCIFIVLLSRSSLLVDEINHLMSETLTITLINTTLAMSAIVFSSQNKIQKRYFVAILGLSSGLLVMIKLSTILAPVVILIFLNVRKQSVREKLITSGIFLIMAVSPSLTSTISDSNSETSLTWYGLVAYAIEFQSEDPKKLDISEDAEKLLDNALMKRADTWKKYPEVVREYNFTFQKTPISLYYSALPAAQDLGFNESDQTYTSRLFREITISSFMAHKNLALKALGENLLVPLGLFKLDGQYLSMSKVLKNPITYVLFLSVFFRYFSRRSSTDFLFVSMLISFVVINYFVVSIFNGPIPRYFSLYDPLLLYSMIIAFSRCLDQPKENVQ